VFGIPWSRLRLPRWEGDLSDVMYGLGPDGDWADLLRACPHALLSSVKSAGLTSPARWSRPTAGDDPDTRPQLGLRVGPDVDAARLEVALLWFPRATHFVVECRTGLVLAQACAVLAAHPTVASLVVLGSPLLDLQCLLDVVDVLPGLRSIEVPQRANGDGEERLARAAARRGVELTYGLSIYQPES
jgi:hypothetical protein